MENTKTGKLTEFIQATPPGSVITETKQTLDMGKHSYNPSTCEARAEGLQVPSQPELSNKVLSQKANQ